MREMLEGLKAVLATGIGIWLEIYKEKRFENGETYF
jgi:hypothetical protein